MKRQEKERKEQTQLSMMKEVGDKRAARVSRVNLDSFFYICFPLENGTEMDLKGAKGFLEITNPTCSSAGQRKITNPSSYCLFHYFIYIFMLIDLVIS